MLKGVWVPVVTSSLPSRQLAMQAWGSIATCCTAGMWKVSSTITWAASNPSAWSSGSGSAVYGSPWGSPAVRIRKRWHTLVPSRGRRPK